MISMSVPHTPTARVSTRTAPSSTDGSSMSSSRVVPSCMGTTVSAFTLSFLSLSCCSAFSVLLAADGAAGSEPVAARRLDGAGAAGAGAPMERRDLAGEPLAVRQPLHPGRVAGEVDGAVDEGDVGEGLREVADEPLGDRVVLLGEQPDVVAQRHEA